MYWKNYSFDLILALDLKWMTKLSRFHHLVTNHFILDQSGGQTDQPTDRLTSRQSDQTRLHPSLLAWLKTNWYRQECQLLLQTVAAVSGLRAQNNNPSQTEISWHKQTE